jgi:hypothetical protein
MRVRYTGDQAIVIPSLGVAMRPADVITIAPEDYDKIKSSGNFELVAKKLAGKEETLEVDVPN